MKLTSKLIVNIKEKEVKAIVKNANRKALKDTITDIANDAIKLSPYLHGDNRRSIKYEMGPNAPIAISDEQGAVYSTSGYGGYLETGTHRDDGTWRMPPRPYFRPALDHHIGKLPKRIKENLR